MQRCALLTLFQTGSSVDRVAVTQHEAGGGDADNVEVGFSPSISVPSFHAPAAGDDVDAMTSAQRLVLERAQDSVEERNFELGQRLKKFVSYIRCKVVCVYVLDLQSIVHHVYTSSYFLPHDK